jgi:hypothetical protein
MTDNVTPYIPPRRDVVATARVIEVQLQLPGGVAYQLDLAQISDAMLVSEYQRRFRVPDLPHVVDERRRAVTADARDQHAAMGLEDSELLAICWERLGLPTAAELNDQAMIIDPLVGHFTANAGHFLALAETLRRLARASEGL